MPTSWSDRSKIVLLLAKQEADRLEAETIKPEHILVGLLKSNANAGALVKKAGVTLRAVRELIEENRPEKKLEFFIIHSAAGEVMQNPEFHYPGDQS